MLKKIFGSEINKNDEEEEELNFLDVDNEDDRDNIENDRLSNTSDDDTNQKLDDFIKNKRNKFKDLVGWILPDFSIIDDLIKFLDKFQCAMMALQSDTCDAGLKSVVELNNCYLFLSGFLVVLMENVYQC